MSMQDLYVVAMEYLSQENVCLLNTIDDVSVWTTNDIKVGIIYSCVKSNSR